MLGLTPCSPPTQLGAITVLKPALPLLLLMALPGRAAPVLPISLGECGAELQNVELEAGMPAEWVCAAMDATTTLRFDTAILVEKTLLEGSEVSLTSTPTAVYLEATRELAVGEQRRLTVFFADGREPSSATFVLVGQGAGKPRQVNVLRQPRSAASLRQEVEEQRQRAESCEQQLARREGASASSGLLERLLGLGHLYGITLQWHEVGHFTDTGNNIAADKIWTTRVEVGGGQREASVRLRLRNDSTDAWTLEGASLTSIEGTPLVNVRILAGGPIPAGDFREIHATVGPTDQALTGTYTLKLWGGGREAFVDGVRFR
jgi:uncharacterized protein (TIGR02268 family)